MFKAMHYSMLDIFFHTVLLSTTTLFCQEGNDVRLLLANAYEDRAGYKIKDEEQAKIDREGWSPTYGEITPEGASSLIKEYNLGDKDVFYDLGCGVGKLVFQVFLEGGVKKSAGVELSPTRIQYAQNVHEKLKDSLPKTDERTIEFIEKNMLDADLSDATALYVASTCFKNDVMSKLAKKLSTLPPGAQLVTLTELPELHNFKHVKTITLPMTWSKQTKAHFYVIDPQAKKRTP